MADTKGATGSHLWGEGSADLGPVENVLLVSTWQEGCKDPGSLPSGLQGVGKLMPLPPSEAILLPRKSKGFFLKHWCHMARPEFSCDLGL